MRRLADNTLRRAESFNPDVRLLGVVRTLIAVAELLGILLTPDSKLFAYGAGTPGESTCAGDRGLTLWCVSGQSSHALGTVRILAIVLLLLVASGIRPQWTCVPHWYLACSFNADVTLSDGGDSVAAVVTLLLIPMLLGDRRTWHWTHPRKGLTSTWRGSSYAAWCTLRIQTTIIYGQAALSKLMYPEWRNGTAMTSVFVDPSNGLPLGVRHLVEPALESAALSKAISWTTIFIELVIAACALSVRATRAAALLAGLLHGGIALALGLESFSLIMIATVLAVHGGAGREKQRTIRSFRPTSGELVSSF